MMSAAEEMYSANEGEKSKYLRARQTQTDSLLAAAAAAEPHVNIKLPPFYTLLQHMLAA